MFARSCKHPIIVTASESKEIPLHFIDCFPTSCPQTVTVFITSLTDRSRVYTEIR